jgi:hypothetical protein
LNFGEVIVELKFYGFVTLDVNLIYCEHLDCDFFFSIVLLTLVEGWTLGES